jgi:hypothetical protein
VRIITAEEGGRNDEKQVTPAGKTAKWTTVVAVPDDVKNLYIMLSAEAGKQRLFANYCVDITDK